MKEITALIRPSKVDDTKQALAAVGLPAFTGRKVFGRGKKAVDVFENGKVVSKSDIVPKRMFIIAVGDDDVKKAVDIIMLVNRTGQPGDGRIFVTPIDESYRISTGEKL